MAITTLDGLVAGFRPPWLINKSTNTAAAGRWMSMWDASGVPGVGAASTAGVNGEVLSSTSALVAGQLPHFDPASGNAYLANLVAMHSGTFGRILVCDRLWHNNGLSVTSTSAQAITTPTWPSRCPTSGSDDTPSTDGHGVIVALEVTTVLGAGTPTFTLTYTNSDGTGSRTATNLPVTVASANPQSTYLFGLQAGDKGVRSIQSFQANATSTSGAFRLVALRVLAGVDANITGAAGSLDPIRGGLPRLYNGAVPYLMFLPAATNSGLLCGTYQEVHG